MTHKELVIIFEEHIYIKEAKVYIIKTKEISEFLECSQAESGDEISVDKSMIVKWVEEYDLKLKEYLNLNIKYSKQKEIKGYPIKGNSVYKLYWSFLYDINNEENKLIYKFHQEKEVNFDVSKFTQSSVKEDIIYIVRIDIEKALEDNGLGSGLLDHLKDNFYNYRIYGQIAKEETQKLINFYKKNKFKIIEEKGVKYFLN